MVEAGEAAEKTRVLSGEGEEGEERQKMKILAEAAVVEAWKMI